MPSHIPRSDASRKKEILEKRERELSHAIKNECSMTKVEALAEKVREAKLNLIKAEETHLGVVLKEDDNEKMEARRSNLYEERIKWTEFTVEKIIQGYNA